MLKNYEFKNYLYLKNIFFNFIFLKINLNIFFKIGILLIPGLY
jgi:hypothetical protein